MAGVDLFSLDGRRAILCRPSNATHQDVKRFLRTARVVCKARPFSQNLGSHDPLMLRGAAAKPSFSQQSQETRCAEGCHKVPGTSVCFVELLSPLNEGLEIKHCSRKHDIAMQAMKHAVAQAPECQLWTLRGCKISHDSKKWLRRSGCKHAIVTKKSLEKTCRDCASSLATPVRDGAAPDPPLRPCQKACLEACAKGARVIEMACGTGKTRVIRELAMKQKGKVGRPTRAKGVETGSGMRQSLLKLDAFFIYLLRSWSRFPLVSYWSSSLRRCPASVRWALATITRSTWKLGGSLR